MDNIPTTRGTPELISFSCKDGKSRLRRMVPLYDDMGGLLRWDIVRAEDR